MAKARVRQLTNARSRSDGPSDLVYTGPTMALLSENADIGTLVLVASVETKSKDLISYRLADSSTNVFEIDSVSGELRTSGAIDRESLALTGSLTVSLRVETSAGNFLEVPITVVVLDVNDEAPKFNQNEYFALVHENLAPSSPIGGLSIVVSDRDSVIFTNFFQMSRFQLENFEFQDRNAMFDLELIDSSGLFSVEPKSAIGSANIGIRLSNGTLDYENPNHKKFILQVMSIWFLYVKFDF